MDKPTETDTPKSPSPHLQNIGNVFARAEKEVADAEALFVHPQVRSSQEVIHAVESDVFLW